MRVQQLFCTTVAIALFTSPGWRRGPDLVEDRGWPPLRSFAVVIPLLVLLQLFWARDIVTAPSESCRTCLEPSSSALCC